MWCKHEATTFLGYGTQYGHIPVRPHDILLIDGGRGGALCVCGNVITNEDHILGVLWSFMTEFSLLIENEGALCTLRVINVNSEIQGSEGSAPGTGFLVVAPLVGSRGTAPSEVQGAEHVVVVPGNYNILAPILV